MLKSSSTSRDSESCLKIPSGSISESEMFCFEEFIVEGSPRTMTTSFVVAIALLSLSLSFSSLFSLDRSAGWSCCLVFWVCSGGCCVSRNGIAN